MTIFHNLITMSSRRFLSENNKAKAEEGSQLHSTSFLRGNDCSLLINVDDLLLNVSMLAQDYGIFIRNSFVSCQSKKHCIWEHLDLCDFSLLITSGTKMDHACDWRWLSKASNCGGFRWCSKSANVWRLDWKHTLQWWGWTTVRGNRQHGASLKSLLNAEP